MITRRARTLRRATLLIALALVTEANADNGPYFPGGQINGVGIVSATKKDSAGNYQIYGGSTETSSDNWSIAQWNTNSDFPPLAYQSSSDEWTAGNGMSAIHYYPMRNNRDESIAFAQNGQYLPCSDSGGNPLEFDLIAGANGWAAANNPSFYPASSQNTPPLNQLTHYYMSGTYQLLEGRYANQNNGCKVNQSVSSLGVLVLNLNTQPYQFFYYNLTYSTVCYDDKVANSNYNNCAGTAASNAKPYWFWTGNSGPNTHTDAGGHPNWGINDVLTSYGYGSANITDNAKHGFAFDLLPRISQIIANNNLGMDPDVSHWIMQPAAFGQATWGNTFMATQWTGYVPVYSTK